jgi:hypothetical protein
LLPWRPHAGSSTHKETASAAYTVPDTSIWACSHPLQQVLRLIDGAGCRSKQASDGPWVVESVRRGACLVEACRNSKSPVAMLL